MAGTQTGAARRIRVEISPDRLQAWVSLGGGKPKPSPEPAEILDALTEAKIAVDDEVRSRVSALVEAISSDAPLPQRFLVAQGKAAVEAQVGAFVWDAELERMRALQTDAGAVNYFEISNVVTVGIGVVIGKIVPPQPGKEGVDVCGNRLRPKTSRTTIQLGSGVELSSADQSTVISKVAGRVLCQQGKISIAETLEIKGDVDFKTGSIDSSVDVNITGTIRDNFQVRSEKSVSVGGCIEQATIVAQGDVTVRNGILGRGKGVVTTGGRCVAKFCEGATLTSTGEVQITREVMNSTIYTDSKLSVSRGSLVGGSAYAKEGMEVEVLGKPCGTPTEVIVGMHPSVFARINGLDEELKAKKAMLAATAQQLKPLTDNLKRLTPDLKKRAAELADKLRTLEQTITEMEQTRKTVLTQASPSSIPSVLVSKVAHEGVRIRIGCLECRLDSELKGPVRIELRIVDNVTRLAAVNQLTSSVALLPTSRVQETPAQTACPARPGEASSPEPVEPEPAISGS
jgi:uncharacterized protein